MRGMSVVAEDRAIVIPPHATRLWLLYILDSVGVVAGGGCLKIVPHEIAYCEHQHNQRGFSVMVMRKGREMLSGGIMGGVLKSRFHFRSMNIKGMLSLSVFIIPMSMGCKSANGLEGTKAEQPIMGAVRDDSDDAFDVGRQQQHGSYEVLWVAKEDWQDIPEEMGDYIFYLSQKLEASPGGHPPPFHCHIRLRNSRGDVAWRVSICRGAAEMYVNDSFHLVPYNKRERLRELLETAEHSGGRVIHKAPMKAGRR